MAQAMLQSLGLAAKPVDPQEQIKQWKRSISKQVRQIEREIRALEREEAKSAKECKALATKNQKAAAKVLAKEIVRARKAKEKMYTTRAMMNNMSMQLSATQAMVKAAGCMQRSTEVMKSLNDMHKIGQMNQDMHALAREMEKSGMIEEILNEGFEAMDGEEVDEEATAEVDKVVSELTEGLFEGTNVVPEALPSRQPEAAAAAPAAAEEAPAASEPEDADVEALRSRLQAL